MLFWANHFSSLKKSLGGWSCSLFSWAPLFPSPFLSILLLTTFPFSSAACVNFYIYRCLNVYYILLLLLHMCIPLCLGVAQKWWDGLLCLWEVGVRSEGLYRNVMWVFWQRQEAHVPTVRDIYYRRMDNPVIFCSFFSFTLFFHLFDFGKAIGLSLWLWEQIRLPGLGY